GKGGGGYLSFVLFFSSEFFADRGYCDIKQPFHPPLGAGTTSWLNDLRSFLGGLSRSTGFARLLSHFAEQKVNPGDFIITENLIAESDLLIDGCDLGDCRHPQLFCVFGGSLMDGAFVSRAFECPQHLLIKRHG